MIYKKCLFISQFFTLVLSTACLLQADININHITASPKEKSALETKTLAFSSYEQPYITHIKMSKRLEPFFLPLSMSTLTAMIGYLSFYNAQSPQGKKAGALVCALLGGLAGVLINGLESHTNWKSDLKRIFIGLTGMGIPATILFIKLMSTPSSVSYQYS